MNRKTVFVPDDAGSDMVTALRYLMSNPWAASRIQSARWQDTEWMSQQDIDGYTAALCDVHPLGTDGDLEEALAYSPAVSTFDYIIPERRWVPDVLEYVPEPLPDSEEPQSPEDNKAQKILARMWKGDEGYLSKGPAAMVINPFTITWSWRVSALRGWEVSTNWVTQFWQRHKGQSTAKHLGDLERLRDGYEKAFLVGLDNALDELVMACRGSADFQASKIELLRGDINNPPNATSGNSPGVVVPG